MRGLWLFLLAAAAGCGDSMLDRATSGAGCHAEERPGSVGICDGERLACRVGFFDRDGQAANGCEARIDQAGSDVSLFTLEPGGLGALTIGGQFVDLGLTGGWVAFRGMTPCMATISRPCAYELLALQVGIGSYSIGSLSWTEGLVATAIPLDVVDDGGGLFVPSGADLIGSFLVEGEKRVVSRASSTGITVASNGQMVVVTGAVALPFGGYPIEEYFFVAEGALAAPN